MGDEPHTETDRPTGSGTAGAESAAEQDAWEGATDPAVAEHPPADAAAEAEAQVEEDLDELTVAQRERDEYLELAQRTKADFENYRKRVAGETAEATLRGKAELARELIPSLDNLELALKAAGIDPSDPDAQTDDGLGRGVVLIYRELRGGLERAGVESYDPAGEKFDPSLHEAISAQSVEGTDAGVVIETLDRGYRLDGAVLRAARVVVSE
ncbi:MAG: nucleotide exchange factor GrpE [bacterium]